MTFTNQFKAKIIAILAVIILMLIIIFYTQFRQGSVLGVNENQTASYRIASIVPLTKAGTNVGVPYSNGLKLAIDEINQSGGIKGKQIQLDIQDGQLDPQISLNAYKYLTKESKPDVATVLFEVPAKSIVEQAKSDQIPIISHVFVRSIIENNEWSFKNGFDSENGCKDLVNYAKSIGNYNKIGFIGPDLGFNRVCVDSVSKLLPEFKTYFYNLGNEDYANLIAKAKNDGIDTLISIGFDYQMVDFFKQLSQSNSNIKVLCVITSECIFDDVIKSANPNVLNNTLAIDYLPVITQTNFSTKYRSIYPNAPMNEIAWASAGYEEGKMLTKTFESCDPGDRECIKTTLETLKNYDNSAIGSKGFKDRIMQLDYTIYRFVDGIWRYESRNSG
jgi:branched-chain amino acid transport system substrate-binding protein